MIEFDEITHITSKLNKLEKRLDIKNEAMIKICNLIDINNDMNLINIKNTILKQMFKQINEVKNEQSYH
jgi:hypothetical protein